MLITRSQITRLEKEASERFAVRVCNWLRTHVNHEVAHLSESELKAFVEESRTNAARHRIVSERGIVKWALLRLIAGPDFHELPELRELLCVESNSEAMLALVCDRLGIIEKRGS
jgi:hypothetical protein